jgi:acetyl esterase/lipase
MLGIFAGSFTSCKKGIDEALNQNLKEETYTNIAYGNDSKQQMDVYLPAGRSDTTKLIILIHGGAWVQGDKAEFTPYIADLKQRFPGYAFINVNYRLASQTENHFPAQENDIKAAITFIYQKRNEYHISDKIGLLGASAGGHLALLHAYKYQSPVKIKAVASFFGPTDMAGMYAAQSTPLHQSLMQLLVGGTPSSHPVLYEQSSPLFFANAQSPPTILFHGSLDNIVPVSHSVNLKNKLQLLGVANQYHFYQTEGHEVWSQTNMNDAFSKIEAFFKVHMQ